MLAAGMFDEFLECGFGVPGAGRAGEHDVTSPPLRDANKLRVDDLVGDRISESCELVARRLEHAGVVVADRGHVLDAEHLRLEYSGGTCQPCVELVTRVAAAGVIVEVRIPLARRPGQTEL